MPPRFVYLFFRVRSLSHEDGRVHLHRLAGQLLRRAEDQPKGCSLTVVGLLMQELWST